MYLWPSFIHLQMNLLSLMTRKCFDLFTPSPGDLQALLKEVKTQLKKNNYINFNSLTDAFLQYDRNRSGTIDINELKKVCHKQNLPLDDDLMAAVSTPTLPLLDHPPPM